MRVPSGRLSSVGEEFSTNSSLSASSPKRSILNDGKLADDGFQDKSNKLKITIPKSTSQSRVVHTTISVF